MRTEHYAGLSDEELVARYQRGETAAADYLVEKYKNLVRMKARSYFLVGADHDDLIQEGMIGLYKAIRDYEPEHQAVFMTFASLCISRQIRTAVTASNRQKNAPLNSYVSLDSPVSDETDEDAKLSDVLESRVEKSPEEIFFANEQKEDQLTRLLACLTKLERQVLELYLEGMSYTQIAKALDKPAKSIDNAIQRIRAKATR